MAMSTEKLGKGKPRNHEHLTSLDKQEIKKNMTKGKNTWGQLKSGTKITAIPTVSPLLML
jgi:hypothetical protein